MMEKKPNTARIYLLILQQSAFRMLPMRPTSDEAATLQHEYQFHTNIRMISRITITNTLTHDHSGKQTKTVRKHQAIQQSAVIL